MGVKNCCVLLLAPFFLKAKATLFLTFLFVSWTVLALAYYVQIEERQPEINPRKLVLVF
jgi:hypothetical protein